VRAACLGVLAEAEGPEDPEGPSAGRAGAEQQTGKPLITGLVRRPRPARLGGATHGAKGEAVVIIWRTPTLGRCSGWRCCCRVEAHRVFLLLAVTGSFRGAHEMFTT